MRNVLLGVFLGLAVASLSAQISDNAAIYGRNLGSGIATWLGTPSSANLASALTDETGSGPVVFGTNPTLTQTPVAVGSLPVCGAGTANQIAIVNDALAPALGIGLSAGGALTVSVICKSGTGWIVL